jgi:hypothetical protein
LNNFINNLEGKMKRLFLLTLALTLALFLLSNCAGPTRLEMDFGTSYKLANFNQTFNPEAEKNLEPVTGLDAQTAKIAYDQYLKSFQKTEALPAGAVTLGILGAGGK